MLLEKGCTQAQQPGSCCVRLLPEQAGAPGKGQLGRLRPFKAHKKAFKLRRSVPCTASALNGSGPSSNGSQRNSEQDDLATTGMGTRSLDERILSGEVFCRTFTL